MRRLKPEILSALVRAGIRARQEQAQIAEEFNRDKQEAVESHDLHPRAFTLCLTLARMDQVKRLALLAAFDRYREILKLNDAPQTEAFDEQRPAA